ncbi:PREDICTED: uncharacterized protein LOC108567257 [Nicrophorus vespilloides]|uniref:Uncharacterized protein LOC108567257 n=1 Tax=Nicrophorus vespilloides TaxID=110193 RepID=A0ABM1N8F4_NICVS|nr:PREDICTED: uncharacterized protein LOC108567257 [Nicrophorus vespilloides]
MSAHQFYKYFVFFAFALMGALTFSDFEGKVQVILDDDGNDFYLVPIDLLDHIRNKRATNISSGGNSNGDYVRISTDLHKTADYNLQGGAFGNTDANRQSISGGQLDLSHIPSDSKLSGILTTKGVYLDGNLNGNNFQLTGSGFAEKNDFNKVESGGRVTLTHTPSESNVNFALKNVPGSGTVQQTGGTYNFFKTADGRGTIGLTGNYNVNRGGGGGTRSCNALLHGKYSF